MNQGLFVRIKREGPGQGEVSSALDLHQRPAKLKPGQEYQITHPQACVNGILKGAYYGTISDQISVTCSGGAEGKTKLRAILDYKDEVGH